VHTGRSRLALHPPAAPPSLQSSLLNIPTALDPALSAARLPGVTPAPAPRPGAPSGGGRRLCHPRSTPPASRQQLHCILAAAAAAAGAQPGAHAKLPTCRPACAGGGSNLGLILGLSLGLGGGALLLGLLGLLAATRGLGRLARPWPRRRGFSKFEDGSAAAAAAAAAAIESGGPFGPGPSGPGPSVSGAAAAETCSSSCAAVLLLVTAGQLPMVLTRLPLCLASAGAPAAVLPALPRPLLHLHPRPWGYRAQRQRCCRQVSWPVRSPTACRHRSPPAL
jgi:hypothetical protein